MRHQKQALARDPKVWFRDGHR